MSYLSEEDLKTINEISIKSKINNKIRNQKLVKTIYYLENYKFNTSNFIENINNLGVSTNEISINYKSLEEMKK